MMRLISLTSLSKTVINTFNSLREGEAGGQQTSISEEICIPHRTSKMKIFLCEK